MTQSATTAVAHVPPTVSPQAALAALGANAEAPVVSGLLWVPFAGPGGPAMLPPDHELFALAAPPSGLTTHRAAAPLGPEDQLISANTQGGRTPLYVPYWTLINPDGRRALVSGLTGELLLSSFSNQQRQRTLRMIVGLCLILTAASYCIFASSSLVVLLTNATGDGATISPGSMLLWSLVRVAALGALYIKRIRPALIEVMAERSVPLINPGVSVNLGRVLVWLAVSLCLATVFSLWVGYDGSVVSMALIVAMPSLCIVLVTKVYRAREATQAVLSDAARTEFLETHWGTLAITISAVIGAVLLAATLNSVWESLGLDQLPMYIFPGAPAWESNAVESKFIAVAVLIAVRLSHLSWNEKATMITALGVPLVTEPIVGTPGAALLQLMSVFAIRYYIDRRDGNLISGRDSLERALRFEVALISGGLIGRFLGIALIGTSGNTVGDLIGELVVGGLLLHQMSATPEPTPPEPTKSDPAPPESTTPLPAPTA